VLVVVKGRHTHRR